MSEKANKPSHGEKAISSLSIAGIALGNAGLETLKGTGSALSWLYNSGKRNGGKTLAAAKKGGGVFLKALDEATSSDDEVQITEEEIKEAILAARAKKLQETPKAEE
jgi:hypothetical protein